MVEEKMTEFAPKVVDHRCTLETDGEWEVYRCTVCPNYERRLNRSTGEMVVRGLSALASHGGIHRPWAR